MTTKRVLQEATEETFRLISCYATLVPVIVVGTKIDQFFKLCELEVEGEAAKQLKFEERREQIEQILRDLPCRFDAAEYIAKGKPPEQDKTSSAAKSTTEQTTPNPSVCWLAVPLNASTMTKFAIAWSQ
jgi:hypothetical protein